MFIKFFINSLKNNPVWYILTVLSETGLLLIVFCANGIFLDSIANHSNELRNAKFFHIDLNRTLWTSKAEDKDLIDSIFENMDGIEFLGMSVATGSDAKPYYTGFPFVYAFDSYESMETFFSERFGLKQDDIPTRQQYENHEKVVIMGTPGTDEDWNPVSFRYLDNNHLLVGPDDIPCTIAGYSGSITGICMIYGCEPENTPIYSISIHLKYVPTNQQVTEIENFLRNTFGENITGLWKPDVYDLLDIRKNGANILLSAFMLILVVFNISLIFKQSVERRSRELAVFRLCGFSQKTSIVYVLSEMLIISSLSSVAACAAFELAVKNRILSYYSFVNTLFTPGYYSLLIIAFMAIMALMFAVFVAPIVKKKSIALQFCCL